MHHPTAPTEARDLVVERHNARLGLVLFAIYLAGYAAYMIVNAFWPELMDGVPLFGLNWAVASGLLLIAGAIALALVYARFCRNPTGDRA